jgi:hypothetical protein
MQQTYPDPTDKCVSRSVCPTCGEPGYTALLCDALASTTRRMTRGHPFGHFMNILYCEASRSTTCVKTHAHTCRRARNSKDLHIIRKASRMRYADAASHASPHYILPPPIPVRPRAEGRAQQNNKRPSNMRRLRILPTGNPPPVLPDPSRSLRIGVPTI